MQKQNTVVDVWTYRLPMLLSLLFLSTGIALGQANFWSVFGDPSCTTCCSQTNRFNCRAAPTATSTAPIANIVDPYATTTSGLISPSTICQNSMYNAGGQLLFSANRDGIYDQNGTLQCDFRTFGSASTPIYDTVSSSIYTLQATYAISEINIFPIPGTCNSYYVLFWAQDYSTWYADIRCIRVDIDPFSLGLSFTDNVIFDPAVGYVSIAGTGFTASPFPLVIATDNLNSSGSRDFYTLAYNLNAGGTPAGGLSTMRRWTIDPLGNLPTTSFSYPAAMASAGYAGSAAYQSDPYNGKAKILTIAGHKYFTYVSGDRASLSYSPYGWYLQLLDVATGLRIPSSLGFTTNFGTGVNQVQIYGFEYVPSQNVIYISYTDFTYLSSTGPTGGLAYWDNTGYIRPLATTSSNTFDYRNTDIELDKHGDLIMVRNPSLARYTGLNGGELAYLPTSTSGAATTSATPTVLGCTAHPKVSVLNNVSASAGGSGYGYYLGSQIRGGSYTNGTDLLNYTVTGAETWTPANNPVAIATGSPAPTISMMGNLNIPAGASLNIQNMTVKFDQASHLFAEASPASSSALGGKLTLDNATLTRDLTGCSGSQKWGGVVLKGDLAQPQLSFATSHEGAINMTNNSTISYADIGIESGWGLTVVGWGGGWGSLWYFMWPIYGISGGGLMNISNSHLVNNYTGAYIAPYRNFNPTTGTEIGNASSFYRSNFTVSDPVLPFGYTYTGRSIYGISGQNVKGIPVTGCVFENTSGNIDNTYGIYADNMGFTVDQTPVMGLGWVHCQFNGLMEGIKHLSSINTNTPTIRYALFNNNGIGVELVGSQAPLLYGNTFNVLNNYTGSYGWTMYYTGGASCAGVILNGASSYIINSNAFNGATYMGGNSTGGVIAYRTGGSDEVIKNNTYSNLCAANLSNYKNTNSDFYSGTGYNQHGLQFLCNNHSNNLFDISARGSNYHTDGICGHQGNSGLTGGNYFSSCSGLHKYNFYIPGPTTTTTPHSEVGQVYYWFAHPIGSTGTYNPQEHPGQPTLSTGYDYGESSTSTDLLVTGLDATDHCLPSSGKEYDGTNVISVDGEFSGSSAVELRLSAINNVNYYMNQPLGMPHRDSLYYWARKIETPAGDRLLAHLYLEDSLVDSANAVYNRITSQYPLDAQETDEYDLYGRSLMDLQIERMAGTSASLTTTQIAALENIYTNAPVWAKAQARNWLQSFVTPDALDPGFAIMDTLLYPVLPDTTLMKGATHNEPGTLLPNGSVYPNPATNMLLVQYIAGPGATAIIELDDVSGRQVMRQQLTNGTTQVDVSQLEAGLYLYVIKEENKVTLKGKITKF